jgi:hypothetical protein
MAGYTRGGRILVAVGGRSLSIDLLREFREVTAVTASDSEGVIVGATVEAIDMLREWSPPAAEEAMLMVLVCAPGACGYPPLGVP